MARLDEIAERCEKATAGPWRTDDIGGLSGMRDSMRPETIMSDFWCCNDADAAFIEHSRDDVEYLLTRLAAAERYIEALKDQLAWGDGEGDARDAWLAAKGEAR